MKPLISALVFLFFLSSAVQAATVGKVEIPDTLKAAGTELKLNGAGIRSKWFMDIYVSGLYLPEASKNAADILKAEKPMAIKLQIVSGLVTSEKMQKATREGFENATGGNTAPIQAHIDELIGIFDKKIVENDVFDLVYVPGIGVEVYRNSEQVAAIGGGLPFKQALFGIWLSDKPVQKDLKQALLGLN